MGRWKGRGKKGRVTRGVELTKAKHIHRWETLRAPLNIEFGINNETLKNRYNVVGVYLWEGEEWSR
jgi:hypothetical protein